jgi:4-aminobutyrate aminotransferase-like enzyme
MNLLLALWGNPDAGNQHLTAFPADFERIAQVGAQLVEGIDAPTVYKALLSRGLICNAVNASTLRFAPPLTVSDAELDEAAGLVAGVLAEVTP